MQFRYYDLILQARELGTNYICLMQNISYTPAPSCFFSPTNCVITLVVVSRKSIDWEIGKEAQMRRDGNYEAAGGSTPHFPHCIVLGPDFGLKKKIKVVPPHFVAPSVLTLGINGVSLLNLQQLMVFTLVGGKLMPLYCMKHKVRIKNIEVSNQEHIS